MKQLLSTAFPRVLQPEQVAGWLGGGWRSGKKKKQLLPDMIH